MRNAVRPERKCTISSEEVLNRIVPIMSKYHFKSKRNFFLRFEFLYVCMHRSSKNMLDDYPSLMQLSKQNFPIYFIQLLLMVLNKYSLITVKKCNPISHNPWEKRWKLAILKLSVVIFI